jgi:hypothetical protein
MTTTYTTTGSVRGNCGHRHKTVRAAAACAEKDARDCRSLSGGAYSDRSVRAIEGGRERDLNNIESAECASTEDSEYAY